MSIVQERHKHSKLVYLRRLPLGIHEANKDLESDYYANATRSIGSFFAKGSTRPATGLTIAEEDLLLPYVLNLPPEDREFRAKVADYYYNIDTKIRSGGGTELEVGLENGGDEVSKDNLPISITDYLRHRHALAFPKLAMSEHEGRGNILMEFYVYDPQRETGTKIKSSELQDEALEAYLLVKKAKTHIDMYLTLLGAYNTNMNSDTKALKLREIAEKRPKDFLDVHKDKNKEVAYFIDRCVAHKILKPIGSRYLIEETHVEIGRDKAQAIQWLRDTRNSKSLITMKAKLQNALQHSGDSTETASDLFDLTDSKEIVASDKKTLDPPLGDLDAESEDSEDETKD